MPTSSAPALPSKDKAHSVQLFTRRSNVESYAQLVDEEP